jgi:hypothetical protein
MTPRTDHSVNYIAAALLIVLVIVALLIVLVIVALLEVAR